MKKTLTSILLLAVLAICTMAFSQVKINELSLTSDDPNGDTRYIELFGPSSLRIDTYEIALVTGQTETSYAILDLAGATIPTDGYYVISWDASKVPNTDKVMSAGQNRIRNDSPTAVVLRQKFTKATVDAVGYSFTYNTTPGAGNPGVLTPGTSYEGNGTGAAGQGIFKIQTGSGPSATRKHASIGRFPDGADTSNNYTDFMAFYKGAGHPGLAGTPGQSNNVGTNASVPINENFTGALTREWSPSISDIRLETTTTAVPPAMPNSPDPVSPQHWASVKNPAGDGDEAIIVDFNAINYDVSGAFYCGPIVTAANGHEVGIFGGRVGFTKNHDNDTGIAPLDPAWYPTLTAHAPYSYRFHMDYVTGRIHAVKFDKNVYTEVAATDPVAIGWHKLEINFSGPVVTYYVDGQVIGTLNSEPTRAGYVLVGYRETVAGSGIARNNFDNILIRDASQSAVKDWSVY